MKKLLLVTAGGVATLALLFTVWNPFQNVEHVAIYKPRSAKLHTQYGAHGAVEVQNQMKKNYFTGQIEAEDILGTRRALTKFSQKHGKDNDMSWNSLGPDNIGGRTRALWINPTNDNHLIGGGVSGGLWQSVNAGNSWEPINSFNKHEDFYQHMTITSITRTGNGIYYIGTGSLHEYFNTSGAGTPGFVGGGLFRSTNSAGTAWENVFAPSLFSTNSEWVTVDGVVVDPNNTDKIWVAHSRGLDTYTHGNANLDSRPSGLPESGQACEDVHVSTDGTVIVASIGKRGYISTNSGQNFSAISGNFENGGPNVLGQGGNGRVEFAISPSDPNYIYAVAVNTNQSLRAVVASFDGGAKWYRIAQDVSATGDSPFQPFGGVGGQGVWDCTISVNPLNPKQIFLGGLVIYSHTVTGNTPALANWEQRSLYSTSYLNPFAVHPDIHWFVWDSNNVFYAATDGGFFKSEEMATSSQPMFYPVNKGYVTTQFYGIAHSNDERTIGGTQDNGTLYQNQLGVTPNQGVEVFGGDGFDCDISYIRPNLLFGSSQNAAIYRSVDGNFGENISPLPVQSNDFTTNIRLVEADNDPYSTRGNNWGVDTLNPSFVPSIQEWDNGNISLGYIPAGYTIEYAAVADQRQLWIDTEEKMYYYKRGIDRDTVTTSYQDTVDVITNITLVDSILTPLDTNYVLDCDTLFNQPLDTTYVDSCVIFLGEQFCIHIDTIVGYQDTIICVVTDTSYVYDVDYFYDTTYTYITDEVFEDVIMRDTLMYYSDSLLLVDRVQSLFAVAYGSGQGIWVTRDALNTSIEPGYWNVDPDLGGQANCLEWSPDRNHLYLGTVGGQLKRYSGFNSVYHTSDLGNLTSQILISSGPPISDIAVDYSAGTGGPDQDPASEMVVVTKSTYGTTDKVLVSMNAASTSSSNSFSSIWNIPAPLNRMPAYSCVIAKSDPNIIVIGTEVGIFKTSNGGTSWSEENGGMMDRVPVFDLRQQYRDPWKVSNSGVIYAGTHGRGIFNNEDFFMPNTGIDDDSGLGDGSLLSNLTIYPNPMTTTGWVEFYLSTPADVRVSIFSLNGKMVNDFVSTNRPKGENQVQFDAGRLTPGTYILALQSNGELKTGKFIVTQ